MKKLLALLFFVLPLLSQAQVPQGINYQAVIRDLGGNVLPNQNVGIKVAILQGSMSGDAVYEESFTTFSGQFGLVNVIIGQGDVLSGEFESIEWGEGPYFIEVSADETGGTDYALLGTQQLMSVPYALYAENSGGTAEPGPEGPQGPEGPAGPQGPQGNDGQGGITEAGENVEITGTGTSEDPYVVNAFQEGETSHYIGELYGGGVIFHLWLDDEGVQHGLIVDMENLSWGYQWSNVTEMIGLASQSSWDGMSNCNAIVSQAGHSTSAASLCLSSSNGQQSDWYLPAIDELNMLWTNRLDVNRTLAASGGSQIVPVGWEVYATELYYWSSTESLINSIYVWGLEAHKGDLDDGFYKAGERIVRAIRAF